MIERIREIGTRFGLEVAVVAHAGDGNLHPVLTTARSQTDGPEPPVRLEEAADALVRAAPALGGTISGEHGIGIAKRPWLRTELGDASLRLQREPARVFDPGAFSFRTPGWPNRGSRNTPTPPSVQQ